MQQTCQQPRLATCGRPHRHYGRISALAAFLCGSFALLLVVCHQYLLPAMSLVPGADAPARKQLAAISLLVLIVVLTALLGLLIVAVRPGRLFLPRKGPSRQRTHYVDAWAESARRLRSPPDESPKE
jgi:hypothetical protein